MNELRRGDEVSFIENGVFYSGSVELIKERTVKVKISDRKSGDVYHVISPLAIVMNCFLFICIVYIRQKLLNLIID